MTKTKTITLLENTNVRFPYPVGNKKTFAVLEYLKRYQEDLILRRVQHYCSTIFINHSYISSVSINDIKFNYELIRNNSHIAKIPLRDRIFKRFQSIDVGIVMEVELLFHNHVNWVKIKNPSFYESLKSNDFLRGMFHSTIFRSILDSNIDDLF